MPNQRSEPADGGKADGDMGVDAPLCPVKHWAGGQVMLEHPKAIFDRVQLGVMATHLGYTRIAQVGPHAMETIQFLIRRNAIQVEFGALILQP